MTTQSLSSYYGSHFSAIVIVDVLSFCTTVDVALAKGCSIIPTKIKNEDELQSLAQQHKAILAKKRNEPGVTLSPVSMVSLHSGQTILLPSPNGSTLVDMASRFEKPVFAGCLRNAQVLSGFLNSKQLFPVLFVAAGERYPNTMLRPAMEDYWGVGSILKALEGEKTIEALSAIQSFKEISRDLKGGVAACESGQELIFHGYGGDVELAAESNCSKEICCLSRQNGCLRLVSRVD